MIGAVHGEYRHFRPDGDHNALHDRALPRDVLDAYGASFRFTRAELIAEVKAWALNWSAAIGPEVAESEAWSDDDRATDRDD